MTETDQTLNRERLRCSYCNKLNTLHADSTAPRCRRCHLLLTEQPHHKWSYVNPDAYIHPLDRQALKALSKIPGVDAVLKKLIGFTSERMYRIFTRANSVRVGPDQYARLDALLDVACHTLNVPKPELYVSVAGDFGGIEINAFTTGVENPFIVLFSGLVERLTDEELLAVIAHEIGHIHCQHLLYRTAAFVLLELMGKAMGGILNSVGMPIQIALLTWMHKSELSCDRTALLVVQNPRVVMSALTKIAGGNLNDELNLDAFIRQAREFDKAYEEDFMDKIWTLMLAARASHPFPVWRISEILKWSEDTTSAGYQQLVAQENRIEAIDKL